MGVVARAIWFLIDTVISLYVMILLLRLMMQMVRANAYNPLCQFVLRLTTPLVKPLQAWVPGYHGIDFAILLLAFAFTIFKFICYAFLLGNFHLSLLSILIWSSGDLLQNIANLMIYLVIARVIISFVQHSLRYNQQFEPIFAVIYSLTEPLLGRVRRNVPLVAGYDLSPLIVIIGLTLLVILIVSPLMSLVRVTP